MEAHIVADDSPSDSSINVQQYLRPIMTVTFGGASGVNLMPVIDSPECAESSLISALTDLIGATYGITMSARFGVGIIKDQYFVRSVLYEAYMELLLMINDEKHDFIREANKPVNSRSFGFFEILLQSMKEDVFYAKWRTTVACTTTNKGMLNYCQLKLSPGWPLTMLDAIIIANCMNVRLSIRCSDGKFGSVHYSYLSCVYGNLGSHESHGMIGLKQWVLHWNCVTNKFTPVCRSQPAHLNLRTGVVNLNAYKAKLSAALIYIEGESLLNLGEIAAGIEHVLEQPTMSSQLSVTSDMSDA
jgi:hypothetical protein